MTSAVALAASAGPPAPAGGGGSDLVVDPYDYGRSYLLTPIVLLSNIILVTIGNIHLSMLLND